MENTVEELNEETGYMENKLYNIKNRQLKYSEFGKFMNSVLAGCIDSDGAVMWFAKEATIKLYFAMYYLDTELNSKNFEENYANYCNIRFEDYRYGIAWEQFADLYNAINKQLKIADEKYKLANKPSLDNLIDTVTKYFNSMSEQFKGINIEDFMTAIGATNDTFKGIDDNKIIQNILETVRQSSSTTVSDDVETKTESKDKIS